jgi:predicted nuclease with RNAse H fold
MKELDVHPRRRAGRPMSAATEASAVRTIIGVDCATDPKNVGLARARWHEDGWRMVETLACSRVEQPKVVVAAWLEEDPDVLLALDAPLGWPAEFGPRLARHQAGGPVPEAPARFFSRATDRFVHRTFKKRPLDVGADRIARTAHAALSLLDAVRRDTGHPLPLAWTPQFVPCPAVIEVYPAATLLGHGLPSTGHKGAENHRARRRIEGVLEEAFVPPLQHAVESMNEHQVDALLCVLAGLDFLRGVALPPEDDALARQEGWIWAKSPVAAAGDSQPQAAG